jgi:hypothetical protein
LPICVVQRRLWIRGSRRIAILRCLAFRLLQVLLRVANFLRPFLAGLVDILCGFVLFFDDVFSRFLHILLIRLASVRSPHESGTQAQLE